MYSGEYDSHKSTPTFLKFLLYPSIVVVFMTWKNSKSGGKAVVGVPTT